jgi:shikimate kinase
MNVILIGMKHCGKSTLGAALATQWNCPFYDVDRMIEDYHAEETSQRLSVREIFSIEGEERFRQLEAKAITELYLRLDDDKSSNVVAVGGRTALNTKVDILIQTMGVVVFLEVSPDEMYARVKRNGLPPFLDESDPEKHFVQIYADRAPHYRRLARLTVNLDGLDVPAALEKLSSELKRANQTKSP